LNRSQGAAIKRFDRVNAILVMLQSRRHLRAADLAERFGVSERSIYRDIRALESAGVPIVGEPGVGYTLDRSYQLPPVNFQRNEALALAIAAKFAASRVGGQVAADATQAMEKVLAVLAPVERRRLTDFVDTIALPAIGAPVPSGDGDDWLPMLQQALTEQRVVELEYQAPQRSLTHRTVEPIGVCHYSLHWHLIAWCRVRQDYRDFRFDRIQRAAVLAEHFKSDQHTGIDGYLDALSSAENVVATTVVFDARVAGFIGAERYRHGFIEARDQGDTVHMRFLCAHPEYLCRWLLQYTTGVLDIDRAEIRAQWLALIEELQLHASRG
ncbi:MAG: YafY family protein, partial [Pseudomonadota bacterium]